MRIATSTVFSNQTLAIENLEAQDETEGQELSSGIALTEPSDGPTIIAQDIQIRNDSSVTTQISQNLTDLNNVLSTTDSSLSSLTAALQSARNLAIQGATDTITASQRQAIGTQVNQLLQQVIGLANTQFDGKYVFSGTAAVAGTSLVTAIGNPPTAVTTQANTVQQNEQLPNGQLVPANATLQQAFNVDAANGSPSVFQALITLRDTLDNGSVVDESSTQVNASDQSVLPTTTIAQLEATNPPILTVPLQADANGNVAFSIASSLSPNGTTVILNPATTVQGAINAINADTAQTGVAASFNFTTQRLSLTDTQNQPFTISNVPSPGAANTGNFTNAFLLSSTADVVTNLSTQLGDLDNTLTVALTAASTVGTTIQTVSALGSVESTRETTDTQVQAGLEGTNVPQVTSQFTLTQTALQAAFDTTTRIEQSNLFDFLNNT
jgi:flagellar hook-associated protein 3 FlgL